jgi:hypothetical protein
MRAEQSSTLIRAFPIEFLLGLQNTNRDYSLGMNSTNAIPDRVNLPSLYEKHEIERPALRVYRLDDIVAAHCHASGKGCQPEEYKKERQNMLETGHYVGYSNGGLL